MTATPHSLVVICPAADRDQVLAVAEAMGVFHTAFGLPATVPATGTNYTVSEVITGTTGSLRINAGTAVAQTGFTSNTPGGVTVGAFWNGSVHASYGNIKWFGCTMRASEFGASELTNLETYYRTIAGL